MSGFNLSALAVCERSVTLFLIIAITLAGLYAFLSLGRAEDPTFTIKSMTFVTAWPGATAKEMQDQVTEPLEKRMQELKWYDRTETFTRPGLSFTTVTLKDPTPPAEVAEEFYQARKKLGDEAQKLPQGVVGPLINDEYGDVTFALYALKARGEPQRVLVRQAEDLRQRLLHVPGVKKVNLIGERPEKIFVDFSYARLATLGVPPRDVFAALNDQNLLTPAGSIDTKGPQVQVRLDGALDDLAKISDTPIVANGRTLKLSDIADVKRGYEDPATYLIRNQGEPALELGVVMKERYNGLQLGRDLDKEAKAIAAEMPLGLSFTKVSDQAVNIQEAYGEFMLKFFVALAVVIAVSLISLGWRVGIVVALAVPLTLAGVFIIMLATGRDFDRITLGALILSLGLLVDDAIIASSRSMVVQNRGGRRPARRGVVRLEPYGRADAGWHAGDGRSGSCRWASPAASSAGEYAGNIFWIVAFALMTSWIVAVVFTPYLGVKIAPRHSSGWRADAHGQIYAHAALLETALRFGIVGWSIRNKFLVAVFGRVVGLFLASIPGLGLIKQQFFPNSDRTEVLVEVQMPEGHQHRGHRRGVASRVEAWLKTQPGGQDRHHLCRPAAPRASYLAMSIPNLPDPSFAKIDRC